MRVILSFLVYDILFLVEDYAFLLRKELLDWVGNRVHDVFAVVEFDEVLIEPVVADEFALAVANLDAREAVRLAAVELLDVLLVVVADVLAECRLLVELGLLPLRAVGVSDIVGAFVPRLENGHDLLVVLNDHKTGVGVCAVETVGVVLRLFRIPRVLRHDERVVRLDVPIVHHPLHGKVHEAKSRIGIEENNELVILDQVGQRRWLDPGCVPVFKFVRMDKFVVVTVDLSVGVVSKNTTGNVVDVAPLVLAHLKHLSGLEWSCVEIQNKNVATHLFRVARLFGKYDLGAVRLANKGLGRRNLERLVQNAQDIVDVWGFCVAEGPVSAGQ